MHLYPSDMTPFGVALRTYTKKTHVLKEIGLHVQNIITIHCSIIDIIGGGGLYDHVMSMRIFLVVINVFLSAQKFTRTVGYGLNRIC
jgi:hypothetical protein